ncbi:DUF2207 family protein [Alkalicoccus daliensis]|uniref:Predicted membrane protein n=1 Tax=Alkalicoccus daliensis TaxID=745820 RepID=A0A1H0AGC4_9BACI|nr:DUF2207 domain-containing protein [Alkalicoccus daliensis]SDN31786.1 Predicted membrane protein [Alkalicoccus daliensis]
MYADLVVFMVIILFLTALFVYLKVLSNYKQSNVLSPQSLSPAAAYYLLQRSVSSSQITGMLLYEVYKGSVKVENKNNEYVYKISDESQKGLLHESFFLKWIFYSIGSSGNFRTSDIWNSTITSGEREKFTESMEEWKNYIEKDLIEKGYLYNMNKAFKIMMLVSLILMITGSLFLFESIIVTIISWSGTVIILLLAVSRKGLTAAGNKKKEELNKYKKNLQSTNQVDKSPDQLTLDYIFSISLNTKSDFTDHYRVLDASEVRIRQDVFPLYMAGSGAALIIQQEDIEDLDSAFSAYLYSPSAESPDTISDFFSGE